MVVVVRIPLTVSHRDLFRPRRYHHLPDDPGAGPELEYPLPGVVMVLGRQREPLGTRMPTPPSLLA